MKILVPGKQRKKQIYYGKCTACGCEFSCDRSEANQDQIGVYLSGCPNKECIGEERFSIPLYTSRKNT